MRARTLALALLILFFTAPVHAASIFAQEDISVSSETAQGGDTTRSLGMSGMIGNGFSGLLRYLSIYLEASGDYADMLDYGVPGSKPVGPLNINISWSAAPDFSGSVSTCSGYVPHDLYPLAGAGWYSIDVSRLNGAGCTQPMNPENYYSLEIDQLTNAGYATGTLRFFGSPSTSGPWPAWSETYGPNGAALNFAVPAIRLESDQTSEASSVLFFPGIEGSRLYMRNMLGVEHILWEPSIFSDIGLLALNQDGSSKNEVYTKDIIDTLYGGLIPDLPDVYKPFERFLDSLVSKRTIREWQSYPYDWRYSPFQIVQQGSLTEQADGSLADIYPIDVLKRMASSSPTGKVTLIGHSNGGLVVKALVYTLGAEAPDYIDQVILIGTPQLGTPQTIGELLHGDGTTKVGGLVMYGGDMRETGRDMPGSYDLLPSSSYFSTILDAPVKFETGSLSSPFASLYGALAEVSNFDSFQNFLKDSDHLDERTGSASDIQIPLALRSDLLEQAKDEHAKLDDWVPPAGIDMISIAGWGQDTAYSYDYFTASGDFYCDRAGLLSWANCGWGPRLGHQALFTSDGDGTVVTGSANRLGETYFFNSQAFEKDSTQNITHLDLTSASPIQSVLFEVISKKSVNLNNFITTSKPVSEGHSLTIIETDGLAQVAATDSNGNESGIFPVAGKANIYYEKKKAKGVSVTPTSKGAKVSVKNDSVYSVSVSGTASTTSKLKITKSDENGVFATTTEYTIPAPKSASSKATVLVANGVVGDLIVHTGEDTPDYALPTDSEVSGDPVSQLKASLESLAVRPGIKNRLLRALQPIEATSSLADVQVAIMELETLLRAQTGVKIPLDTGASMLQLLNKLKS